MAPVGDTAAAMQLEERPARSRRAPARRGEGQALRHDIVEAASRLLARSGDASKLSLRGVAREVGVAATSIYLHFDTIQALIDEVKRTRFEEFADMLAAAADSAGGDPVARVRARGHAYVRYGQEHPGEYVVMFTARLIGPDGSLPRIGQTVRSLHELAVDVEAALRAAGERVAEEVIEEQAHMVALHLWTSLHGNVTLRLVRSRLPWPPIEHQVDDLVDRLVGASRG